MMMNWTRAPAGLGGRCVGGRVADAEREQARGGGAGLRAVRAGVQSAALPAWPGQVAVVLEPCPACCAALRSSPSGVRRAWQHTGP